MPQGWDWWLRKTKMGFGKDGKGVIIMQDLEQTIGTLAQNAGLIISTNPPILERFRMLRADLFATMTSVAAGELGGAELYLADGDLTLPEIEEALEQNGPNGPNDTVAEAIAMRAIFRVGAALARDVSIAQEGVHLINDTGGPLLSVKPRWTFARTKSWNWVLYNNGPAPTTGSILKINAKAFGVWVT